MQIKNRILLITILAFIYNYDAQAQKRYFNSKYEPVTELDSCSHYEITYLDSTDLNKKKVEVYTCDDKLMKTIPFFDNQIDGVVITYDSLGRITKEETYLGGIKNGFSKKYWSNGKLRRQELYIDDKINSGSCFDESGKKVEYYAANREMKLSKRYKDILDYLAINTKYPKEDILNGVSGKVVISFFVNESGKVEDLKITTSISPTIDAEAIRLIKQLPIESPNFVDDIPVRVQFWMPMAFEQQ